MTPELLGGGRWVYTAVIPETRVHIQTPICGQTEATKALSLISGKDIEFWLNVR